MEDTWTIVQFLDDGSVEAIPTKWIQGEHCHWPPYAPQKMQTAIRKLEQLNTCWPAHRVKIFRNGTYDDYMKARAKARVAEDTSDLNTEPEGGLHKRKRTRKVLSSSEESSDDSQDESVLEIPPKLNKKASNNWNEMEIGTKTVGSVPIRNIVHLTESKDEASDSQNRKNDAHSKIESENQQNCKNCTDKDKQVKILIQQGHILRGLMTEALNEIKSIKILMQKQGTVESKKNKSLFDNNEIQFPIVDDEDFEKFETFLQNEDTFSNGIQELSKIGGTNTYDHIKRMMQLIISNQQALKYSWHGMKGNKKFKETATAKLLLKSAEVAGLSENQKSTELAIQTWLRRASDRRVTEGNRIQKKF